MKKNTSIVSKTRRKLLISWVAVLIAASPLTSMAYAASDTLTIGMATPPTSADPYFQNATPNNLLARHLFDALVVFDENQILAPALAESWTMTDPTTWVFKLRPGLTFSDGTPLTSEDVLASLERVKLVKTPGNMAANTKTIASAEAPDASTVVLKTIYPDALLPAQLTRVMVISKKFKDASTSDFNSGAASLGAGPYVLKEYVPGDRVTMTRNEHYWGPKQPWQTVVLKMIPDDGARTASLLAGDVDMVEGVSPSDVAQLKQVSKVKIVSAASNRMVYLALNQEADIAPFVTDKSGKPLTKNPFKDLKVRQAISHALNRPAIAERVMDGFAKPTAQWLPTGAYGTAPGLEPDTYDPALSKKLLAEAGYADGFALTAHASNNRYINDSKIIQAVAQMLARVGIETKAEALPWASYFPKASAHQYGLMLGAWGANTGETSVPMTATVATPDSGKGMGASNYGGYSNAQFDTLLGEALQIVDPDKRNQALGKAAAFAIEDRAIIPIHHEVSIWAVKSSITYVPRADQYTLAMGASPSGE